MTAIHEIRKIRPIRAANIASVVIMAVMAVFASIAGGIAVVASFVEPFRSTFGLAECLIFCAFPLIYGAIGWVATAVAASVYNLVAGWMGGVQVEIEVASTSRSIQSGPPQKAL